MSACEHRSYPTSISAKKALTNAGIKNVRHTDVRKCTLCGKWRVREGLL